MYSFYLLDKYARRSTEVESIAQYMARVGRKGVKGDMLPDILPRILTRFGARLNVTQRS